jgi:O-antigen ligase
MESLTERLRTNPSSYALAVAAAVALAAVGVGALLGFAGPLITLAALAALGVALWALTSVEVGLWGVVAIIALLPFASLPFKVVFTPTFLDLAMGGVLLVYASEWMTRRRRQVALTPAHPLVAAFIVLAVFSFVAGLPNGPLTPNLARQFAELLLGMAFVFVVVDHAGSPKPLGRLVRIVILTGAMAAALGIVLYFLPSAVSDRALSALGVLGYPAGGVLRYIEDNPENAQRAIATSVDPNVLGGLLAIVGGLLTPQLVARRPLLGSRWATYAAFAVVVTCLILTFSRGAMTALGVAWLGIILARYRRLLPAALALAAVILVLPATQAYVAHFAEGLRGQDLATQMRFGEYKDAFILISRHPFGVGFSGAPEIDIYLGVSSAYLIMAEEMGLTGLALFLVTMLTVFAWAFSRRRAVYADEDLTPLWLGAHAGLAAALTVGVVDHYFFNLAFQPAGTFFWMIVGLCLAATRLTRASDL